MKLLPHLIVGFILSLFLFKIGYGIPNILIIFLSSVLIDLDHIQMVVVNKAFTIDKIIQLDKQIYPEYKQHPDTAYLNVIYIFHTIEFNVVLAMTGILNNILFFISLGFIFHTICDVIYFLLKRLPILRWLSFVVWINSNRVNKD